MKNRERTEPFFVYCSFDVRGRPLSKAVQWADPHLLGPRAYFVTVSKPASLTMDSVRLEDAGIYRCRVDFKTSPTRNFAINLTVIGKFLLLFVLMLVRKKNVFFKINKLWKQPKKLLITLQQLSIELQLANISSILINFFSFLFIGF